MRSIEVGFADEYARTGRTSPCLSVTIRVIWKDGTYFVVGAQREPGLMQHACLAFMLVSDDELSHVEQRRTRTQTERAFIDSNASVFQSCS
jgi:hypothetical protein